MCHRLEFARFDFDDKRVIFVGEKTVIKNLESENCGRCGPSKPIPHNIRKSILIRAYDCKQKGCPLGHSSVHLVSRVLSLGFSFVHFCR